MPFDFSFLTTSAMTFEDKKPYEVVITLLRRHWFVLFIQVAGFALLALLPFALYYVITRYVTPLSAGAADQYWLGTAIFFFFWWYGLFYAITMYLLDIWIVTDHRVIDSEQHGFFRRVTAELHLSHVQDISVDITGIIPTFLDYGNLEVQTAAATEKFFFKQIPHPNAVKDMIMDAQARFLQSHPGNVEVHDHL